MFATRTQSHNISQDDIQGTAPTPHLDYLKHLQQQAKQISQIIAYIWRWCDEENQGEYPQQYETACQLKRYFEIPSETPSDVDGKLKKLFGADPSNPEDVSEEANLLRHVFFDDDLNNTNYIFPIFNASELGEEDPNYGYLFNISVNAFTGSIEDAEINDPALLKMTIPYPPRPAFSSATLNEQTLEDWIKNRNDHQFFADNHYIPTSCS